MVIKWLDLESSSMNYILHAASYPNLHTLGLYNINEESVRCLSTELSVINRKSQNRKQSYESNTGNQNLSVIEYSFLGALDLLNVHDDYIEEFLINSKTCFPNNVTLYIHYKSLQRVTHNFTSDTTRINCGKIDELQLYAETKCSNSSLQEYFPSAKIKYRI
ncbi:unnamed protein product [Rotaria socialis]|uniref:Uncharacterized protein n=1 Tax=Rotaria socialis TaxID=392032 RepID=A0A821CW32_9BILA|nr:unnamed protein product [Rotaria socialis]